MKKLKIAVIGGGSSYTPELMEGFIKRYDELPIKEIALCDVKEGEEKVNIIRDFSERMFKAKGIDIKIWASLNRREVLKDADFVITQFRVGQLYARIKDERLPSTFSMLGQETNGAGGIFKALRTIPVMEEIVEDMREVCPDAWLINFTNPSGMVTEAVIKGMGWKKCLGLCNVPTIAMMKEPALLGKEEKDLNYRFFGLNHFHWHMVTDENGEDLTSQIIDHINEEDGGTPVNIYMEPLPMEMMKASNLAPCGYHRYYFKEKEMLEHSLDDFSKNATRAEQMLKLERELFESYKDPNLKSKPKGLEKRGGAFYSDTACECISAIYNDKGKIMVMSTENRGAIPYLDDDSIVEISSIISARGADPLAWGDSRPLQKGYIQIMKAMEESTIKAAFTGDYGYLIDAFYLNPLIENSNDTIKLADQMLVANEKYLPRFKEKIDQLKSSGLEIEDQLVRDLVSRGL